MAFEIKVKKNAFSSAVFYLDENVMRFGEKEIAISSITGFSYMSTQTKVNGINTSKTFDFKIWHEGDVKPFSFSFSGAFGGGSSNEKYLTVTDQLWNYFGNNMLNKLHQDLMQGQTIEISNRLKLTSHGMVIKRKPLFGKAYEVLAPWNMITNDTYQGNVTFKAKGIKKAKTSASLREKHMWLLYYYYDWLQRNPAVVNQLLDVPNKYQLLKGRLDSSAILDQQ